MSTSPNIPATDTSQRDRVPLRLRLRDPSMDDGRIDGVWWPQSRDLQTEAADLVDHFPASAGRVRRLLFSRPDWDDALVGSRSTRRVRARHGAVKAGSFPSDDTQLMVLTMTTGQKVRLAVVPSDTDPVEAEVRLDAADEQSHPEAAEAAWDRWDDEEPTY